MRTVLFGVLAGAALAAGPGAATVRADVPEGFVAIFNGKDLSGWEGKAEFWSVQDGAITGQTTPDKPTRGNTFLIWKGGTPGDFELRVSFRIAAHNSGIQYRSKDHGNHVVGGYQADLDYGNRYTGMLYEEKGRGTLAGRGSKVVIAEDGKKQVTGETGPAKDLLAAIKKDDWNEFVIIAEGNHLVHKINGLVMVDVTDNQESKRAMTGILALQLHAGPPMKVQFKDLYLKESKASK